jgi:hypothetical protein
MGIFDPSVEYATGSEFGLMTYTAVPDPAHVHIAIAASTDGGATWHYQSDVSRAESITIATEDDDVCGVDTCAGTFVQESSSLVIDADDPDVDRRLKVFAHGYFHTGTERWLRLGYLAMYTAATPEGPWAETKLFGWPSPSPISTTGVTHDVATDPSLSGLRDCFIVAEPGGLKRPSGELDLALSCPVVTGSSDTIEVRLLRSSDHGTTWSVVSTLLTPDDALALGSTTRRINGADLFLVGDRPHLIVSPEGPVNGPDGTFEGYRGCLIVAVEDLSAGRVVRCDVAPVVEAAYLGEPGRFVGACSAAEGATANGVLLPIPDFGAPDVFRIFTAPLQ